MKSATSLYLNLVRFAAALTVFIEHLREYTKMRFAAFWGAHPFWYSHWYLFKSNRCHDPLCIVWLRSISAVANLRRPAEMSV
jgi:hypothetical protein